MLECLHIKNVALIDEQIINFSDGLNILTGETGAGKSMVIDSLNFVLGEKVSKDFIRTGETNAFVEALFYLKEDKTLKDIAELGIELASDKAVLITREINKNGRSVSKINGRTATMNMIKDLSAILIDIHGQHEHQSLLNSSKHIDLLDQFCGEQLQLLKNELKKEYRQYKDIQNNIRYLTGDERQREQKIDILQYQTNEIEQAALKPDEEEELFQKRKILVSSEKLSSGINEVNLLLNGGEEAQGVIEQICRVKDVLKNLGNIDPVLGDMAKISEELEMQLEDFGLDVKRYNNDNEQNPEELYNIEQRLDLIYSLKKKYGSSVEEILKNYEKMKAELNFIINSEGELIKLNQQLKNQEAKILKLCEDMGVIRSSKAEKIQQQIENALIDLEMKNARFQINIERRNDFTENGLDKIEFLISANAGEPLKPLSKIASGGEMSRVMLALKSVLADVDKIETLIFDEIDTGVSGRTAQKVAQKMAYISDSHQILCITHLPQIAAMADNHYLIEKQENNGKTITKVFELEDDRAILELARLIGGVEITNSTIVAAKEMKFMAKKK